MRFNTSGEAVYGTFTVSVDGAAVAGLSGVNANNPIWRANTQIIYLDGDSNSLDQIALPATITTLTTDTPTVIRGGSSFWAIYDATNDRVKISHGETFAGARLGDVESKIAIVRDGAAGGPLDVYTGTGILAFSIDTTAVPSSVRMKHGYLCWLDLDGKWNLVSSSDGSSVSWVPQVGSVLAMVPVLVGTTLYVVELLPTVLTLRPATRATAWTLASSPGLFSIDAARLSTTSLRVGACTNPAETIDSLTFYDATFGAGETVSVQVGTVSGGGIVYGPAAPVIPEDVPVGPTAGTTLGGPVQLPDISASIVGTGGTMSRELRYTLMGLNNGIKQIGAIVQNSPQPLPPSPGGGGGGGSTSGASFSEIEVTGQPTITATPANPRFRISSDDDSVEVTNYPAENRVDLSVEGGFCYIPMTTGAIPGEILFVGPDVMLTKVPVV